MGLSGCPQEEMITTMPSHQGNLPGSRFSPGDAVEDAEHAELSRKNYLAAKVSSKTVTM